VPSELTLNLMRHLSGSWCGIPAGVETASASASHTPASQSHPSEDSAATLDAVGSADARVWGFAIRAREDIEIARGVRRALG
jgi:hypothetical protein